MAISSSRGQNEKDKFVDDGSGNVALRLVVTSSSNTSSSLGDSKSSLEYGKFIEDDSGDVAIAILQV